VIFQKINDSLAAKFNRGDYKGIYAMAGGKYQAKNNEADVIDELGYHKNDIGQITSTSLLEDLGEIKYFKWIGQKGVMKVELWLNGTSVVSYQFSYLVASLPLRQVPTDNPLRTVIDSVVHKYAMIYMSDPQACALAIGIYRQGKKLIYNYGEVEKGSGKLPDQNTIYSLGSVSKTFTGLLLARAVTEKKLDLQDDIRKYLDEDYPNLEYQGHPVRLINLANHTSGISLFRFNTYPPGYEKWTPYDWIKYFDAYSQANLLRDLHKLKVDTLPGTRYYYSLGGITLIGLALEKVYHKPLDSIVREYFSKTFDMTDTKLNSDPDDMARYAKGYDGEGKLMPQIPEFTASLYTVKSTTRDMLNYVRANALENNAAIKLSHQVTWGDLKTFAVGLTWEMQNDYDKGKWIFHTGFDYGSITVCSVSPGSRSGIILWANNDNRQGPLFDLERNIRESLDYLEVQRRR
jgi:CubicO group peptidase (beta-lactamase class C family)